jgi:hypothetical protein
VPAKRYLKDSEFDLSGEFWVAVSGLGEEIAHPCDLMKQRFYPCCKKEKQYTACE